MSWPLKVHYDFKKWVMTFKSGSWHQKVCHYVKTFAISSIIHQKVRHNVKNTSLHVHQKVLSWYQTFCHNVRKCVMTSKGVSWRQNVLCHDVQEWDMTSKILHDVTNFIMVLKYVMTAVSEQCYTTLQLSWTDRRWDDIVYYYSWQQLVP